MIFRERYFSPLGEMAAASDGEHLVGLWFVGQRHFAGALKTLPEATTPNLRIFGALREWLDAYFAGENPAISFPICLTGTPFRQAVWREIQKIPYGETRSYGEIGAELSCRSARAIGNAAGHNPLLLLIPCHRVIAASGSLGGYAGGLDRKSCLLRLETSAF